MTQTLQNGKKTVKLCFPRHFGKRTGAPVTSVLWKGLYCWRLPFFLDCRSCKSYTSCNSTSCWTGYLKYLQTSRRNRSIELDDFNIFNSSMNFDRLNPFNTPSASTFYNFSWTGLDAKVRTQMGRKPLYSAVTPSSMRIRLKACTMPQTKWDWQQSTSQQNRCPLWQARSFKNAYSNIFYR